MSKTDEQMVRSGSDPDGRFHTAGRLLGLAWIVSLNRAQGMEEKREPGILREAAIVTAREGIDFARGWVEGWHYPTGSREHATWMTMREILGSGS